VTDWRKDFGLREDAVKGGLCMSGMYDMKPVRLSKRSSYVKFTDEMEQAMSSQRHLDLLRAPIIVTYGTHETPEFQRQSKDFAAAVKAAGNPSTPSRQRTSTTLRYWSRWVIRMGRMAGQPWR
jgi:arylformamidase